MAVRHTDRASWHLQASRGLHTEAKWMAMGLPNNTKEGEGE